MCLNFFFFRKIRNNLSDFKNTVYFKSFLQTWQSCPLVVEAAQENKQVDIICLGLGNFAEGSIQNSLVTSRYQLVLLLALAQQINRDLGQVLVYDPVFSHGEKVVLERLNLRANDNSNREGKYLVKPENLTLFFLPHCPKQLLNNILWTNWSVNRLNKLVIVGNSLSRIVTFTSESELKSVAYVRASSDFVTETPIENNFVYSDIFNDTSLHFVRSSEPDLKDLGAPEYNKDDLEFVQDDGSSKIRDEGDPVVLGRDGDQAGPVANGLVHHGAVQAPPGHSEAALQG